MINRIIEDITNFIFIEDKMDKADAIMIPGSSYPELPEMAAALWKDECAPIIIASGGVSTKTGQFNGVKAKQETYNKNYRTECEFYTDVLQNCGVTIKAIICEDKSGSSADNARLAKKVCDDRKIEIRKAILVCKNFHARRCLMFYQFAFPNTEFIVQPVEYYENGVNITTETWFKTETGQKRVLGELKRLENQFENEFGKMIED